MSEQVAPAIPVPPALGGSERTPLVGRSTERQWLAAAWDRVCSGDRAAILVSGEPGIGKSRLVREVARHAVATGAVVLVGRCTEEVLTPYQPVVEALDHWVASVDDEILDLQCPPVLARLLPRFARRRSIPDAAGSLPESERWELFEGVVSLVAVMAKDHPVMVVVDDLQWIDSSSALLLTHVLRRAAGIRLALVGSYRFGELDADHPMARAIAELRRDHLLEEVSLQGLDATETGELFQAVTQEAGTAAWGAALHGRTGGNPFFVQQLGRHLADSGALAGGPSQLGTPQGVQDVVSHRLRLLSGEANRALTFAAVLGQEFDLGVLQRMLGVDRDSLVSEIEEGLRAQLFVASGDPFSLSFAFAHTLVREAVYEALSPPRRADLHRRAAEAIESSDRPPSASDLAHHWLVAQDLPRALKATVHAAAEAEGVYGWGEAAAHYDTALTLWGKVAGATERVEVEHGELLRRAAEAAHLAGASGRAATLMGDAIREASSDHDRGRLGLLYERLGRYRWWAGDTRASNAAYDRAVDLLSDGPPTLELAKVLASHGGALMVQDRHLDSERRNREALAVARQVGAKAPESYALCSLGTSFGFMGRIDEAVAYLQEARRLAEESGSPEELPRVLVCLSAVLLYEGGQLDQAAQAALEAAEAARRAGVFRMCGPMAIAYAADAYLRLGRWDDCERLTSDFELFEGPPPVVLPVHLVRAELMMRKGRHDLARDLIGVADLLSAGMPDAKNRGYFHLRQAELALCEQRFDDVRTAVDAGLRLVADADNQDRFGPELCAIGVRAEADRLERIAGRDRLGEAGRAQSEAARWVEEVRRITRRSGERGTIPAPDAAAFAVTAEAEYSRVRAGSDPNRWAAVAMSWDAAGYPYPAAYARFRLAEALLAKRQAQALAADNVATALRIASSLGAEPLLSDIRRLVERAHLEVPAATTPGTADSAVADLARLGLTEREAEVLRLLALGKTNRQIASELFISEKTASVHVSNILRKLDVRSRFDAGAVAQRVLGDGTSGRHGTTQ